MYQIDQQQIRTEQPWKTQLTKTLACTPPTLMFLNSLFFAGNRYSLERSYPLQDHPSVIAEFSCLLLSSVLIPLTQPNFLFSSINQPVEESPLTNINKDHLTVKKLNRSDNEFAWAEIEGTSNSSSARCGFKLDVKKFGVPGVMSIVAYLFFLLFASSRYTEMFSNSTFSDNKTADSSQTYPLSILEVLSALLAFAAFFGSACLRLSSATKTDNNEGDASQDQDYGALDNSPTHPPSSTSRSTGVSLLSSIDGMSSQHDDQMNATFNKTNQQQYGQHQHPTSTFSSSSLQPLDRPQNERAMNNQENSTSSDNEDDTEGAALIEQGKQQSDWITTNAFIAKCDDTTTDDVSVSKKPDDDSSLVELSTIELEPSTVKVDEQNNISKKDELDQFLENLSVEAEKAEQLETISNDK